MKANDVLCQSVRYSVDIKFLPDKMQKDYDNFTQRSGIGTQYLAFTYETSDTGLWTNRLTSYRESSSRHPCESRAFACVDCLDHSSYVQWSLSLETFKSTSKITDQVVEKIKLVFVTRIYDEDSRQFLETRLCSLTSRASRARRQITCSVQWCIRVCTESLSLQQKESWKLWGLQTFALWQHSHQYMSTLQKSVLDDSLGVFCFETFGQLNVTINYRCPSIVRTKTRTIGNEF